MKKILLLTENFPPKDGGSSRWFWELYSRLPRENVIVAANDTEEATAFDKTHDIVVLRMPLSSPEWGFASLKGAIFYFKTFFNVLRAVKKHDITEVHCGRVIPEGVITWLVSKFTGVKYICFVHGEDVETAATSREHSMLVTQVCKGADYLLCNSHNSAKLVANYGFASIDKCEVVHPGVDVDTFCISSCDDDFKTALGWNGKRVMLTVGRLQQRKGQDFLIKAMPALLKQHPDLFYAIVGRGEEREALQTLIDELGLSQSVRIYTELDDNSLVKAYQQCDFFILPNRTIGNDIEGFGMVLVEAQACGKPVIAGNSGGTAETMKQGETGYVVDCTSPENIVSELLPLLEGHALALDSQDQREFVNASFSWEQHMLKIKALFSV